MIQRIQSVYLLLVAVLMGIAVISPLCSYTIADTHSLLSLTSCGIFTKTISYPTFGIITISVIILLVAFVEIFLYKKRKLQIKLSNINIVLIILFYITMAVYAYVGLRKYHLNFEKADYGLLFPIIAFILNILAKKKIQQDEKLVRSLDRIR